jgi:hypothetical protein
VCGQRIRGQGIRAHGDVIVYHIRAQRLCACVRADPVACGPGNVPHSARVPAVARAVMAVRGVNGMKGVTGRRAWPASTGDERGFLTQEVEIRLAERTTRPSTFSNTLM